VNLPPPGSVRFLEQSQSVLRTGIARVRKHGPYASPTEEVAIVEGFLGLACARGAVPSQVIPRSAKLVLTRTRSL
jgi:hypothetical protein